MEGALILPIPMNYPRHIAWSVSLLAAFLILLSWHEKQPPSESVGSPALSALLPTEPTTLLSTSREPEEKLVPPAMATFHGWTERYRAASGGKARQSLEAEGLVLAQARLTAMADLIQLDPARAFEQAESYENRKMLPPAIRELLEQPINGEGDLAVLGIVGEPGIPSTLPPVMRSATIEGEEYQVFTHGAGSRFMTKRGIPLYGLAVPNDAASVPFVTALGHPKNLLALSDSPARWIDSAELKDLIDQRAATQQLDPICSVSKQPVSSKNEETSFELGGNLHSFCGKVDAQLWLKARIAAMGLDTPTSNLPPLDTAESNYTEGRKKLLLMRPIWSDYKGGMSTNDALTHYQNFSNYMFEMSYGKLILAPIGKGSDITPAMTLPGLVATYDNTGLGKLYQTSLDVASTTYGYVLGNYDFLYVTTADKPAASYCGLAYVGGVGIHLANKCWDPAVSSHEFGHNLGLNHAHFWNTAARSVTGDGQNEEYGDRNDPMGGGASPNQYNSRYKNFLGWIKDTDVADLNVSGSGSYRLYCFDLNEGSGLRGLKFKRDASQNYWVNFRQRKTDKKSLMNGVQLLWTGNGNEGSYLLDVKLKGDSDNNAIVIGRTFSDSRLGFHFTPVGKANTYPESMDVVVNIGTFPTNLPPVAFVSASLLNPSPSQTVSFSASAVDPNGDALAYFWEFGDGDFSIDNRPRVNHSFADAGEYAVQCSVSDMKGGSTRHTLIVQVGSRTTFRISGHVVDSKSQPLQGIKVFADAAHFAYSDSDGSYTVVNLPAALYNLDALEPLAGLVSFAHPYFDNPISVGPDRQAADFIGVKGSLIVKTPFIAKKASGWRYLDTGLDPGSTWTEPTFDDRTWKTGAAILGYGQGNESTVLKFGPDSNNKYPSYYFRKSFVVKDPLTYTNYSVEVLRDDGVILYLNGTEFYRNNMPAGEPSSSTHAVDTVEPDSYLQTVLPNSALVAGINWIAAEVHQATGNSSDLNLDVALSGNSLSNVAGFSIVYLSEPLDQSTLIGPTPVQLTASVSSLVSVTRVDFLADSVKVGESASEPYSFTWTGATDGSHLLQAIATIGSVTVTSPPTRIRITTPVSELHPIDLVTAGSHWRYLARASAAPAGWNTLTFNDSTWSDGVAKLGFGHSDETTLISGGPAASRFLTIYFRNRFVLQDPGALKTLTALLARDDGAAVYINGVEVLRDNLPSTTLSYSTLAFSSLDNGSVFHPFSLPASALALLIPGTNVVAVEVHQTSATSSDLAFDLSLMGAGDAPRSRGCWVKGPADGATLSSSDGVPISARVVVGGGLAVAKVEFYADGVKLGEAVGAPYAFTWQEPPSGPHTLSATATDSLGDTVTSVGVQIHVTARPALAQWISFGAVWRYLDNGSDQGTSWNRSVFDDRSWKAGAARLGYGESGLETVLSNGTNTTHRFITSYFRSAFTVDNPAQYADLRLHLVRNDGLVVYLNGAEVYRDNLPPGKVSYNTLAPLKITAATEVVTGTLVLPAGGLLAGTNVIAVEIHQQTQTSTDASFDLSLAGTLQSPPSAEIYLTSPGQGAHFNQPGSVELAAQVNSPSAPVRVEYFANNQKVGESDTFPFHVKWNNVASGSYSVIAVATVPGAPLTSPPVTLSVGPAPPPISPVLDKLIPLSSQWRYWDLVSPVSEVWKTDDFDDSAWLLGKARFGYGRDGELTTLNAGRTSYSFRHEIRVDQPAAYHSLVFQLIRDAGAVVYLNGVELYRSNMPAGAINANTPASSVVNTPEESFLYETTIGLTGSGLAEGTNVVAVELHLQSSTSSDAAFDLQLLGVGTTERRLTLTAPAVGGYLSLGLPMEIEAAIQTGGAGSVTQLEFFSDGQKLGQTTSAPWRFVWPDAILGNHILQARATFDDGTVLESPTLKAVVSPRLVATQLIAPDAVWRYNDSGVNLATAWRDRAYNDSAWSSGPARLGYGDDGEATTLEFGSDPNNKHITTYFRNAFVVGSNSVTTNLSFRFQRDDGIAVFLNGKELFRNNLAAGAGFTTLAASNVSGADEQNWFTTNTVSTGLVVGTNVLAAEIHQTSVASTDLGFALELIGNGYSKDTPAARPTVQVQILVDGRIEFSWPSSVAGYGLYTAPTLDTPQASWTLVKIAPASVGTRTSVVLLPSDNPAFFRLLSP